MEGILARAALFRQYFILSIDRLFYSVTMGDMGRKALAEGDKLLMVGGAVPLTVKTVIKRIALAEKWTVSQTLRQLLEESPRVKIVLREFKKNDNKRPK